MTYPIGTKVRYDNDWYEVYGYTNTHYRLRGGPQNKDYYRAPFEGHDSLDTFHEIILPFEYQKRLAKVYAI